MLIQICFSFSVIHLEGYFKIGEGWKLKMYLSKNNLILKEKPISDNPQSLAKCLFKIINKSL